VSQNSNIKPETNKEQPVEVEITSKRWGVNDSPSIKIIEVPLISDSTIRLDITVNIRKTDTIIIRPVRRNLNDIDGLLDDAKHLANN
jgi:hypothetical protein